MAGHTQQQVPTINHQFGATDIYRLNLLFLKLKDKMRWESRRAASLPVATAVRAGTIECPAQRQGSQRAKSRALGSGLIPATVLLGSRGGSVPLWLSASSSGR